MKPIRTIEITDIPENFSCPDTYLLKAVIMKDPDGCLILTVGVNKKGSDVDHTIELNVDWIKDEGRQDWLANLLLHDIYKLVTNAKKELGNEVRSNITKTMQLLGESPLKGFGL